MLYAETLLVPSLAITLELIMLDMTVPQDTMTVTKLPNEKGSPKSEYIAGHAVPKSESGIPKPIKAIYIIINNAVAIECSPVACKKLMLFLILNIKNYTTRE